MVRNKCNKRKQCKLSRLVSAHGPQGRLSYIQVPAVCGKPIFMTGKNNV